MIDYFCPKINLSKKYITSAKTLYTEYLTLNYLCENSPNYLCHYITFTTQLLCIFLAQTLHKFYKSNPSKCKFPDFLLLEFKFTKFVMSFFKQKISFLQNLDLFSVSWEIILRYFFSWNFIWFLQEQPIKVQNLRNILTAQVSFTKFVIW